MYGTLGWKKNEDGTLSRPVPRIYPDDAAQAARRKLPAELDLAMVTILFKIDRDIANVASHGSEGLLVGSKEFAAIPVDLRLRASKCFQLEYLARGFSLSTPSTESLPFSISWAHAFEEDPDAWPPKPGTRKFERFKDVDGVEWCDVRYTITPEETFE